MASLRILLVEDDALLGDAIQTGLQQDMQATIDWARDTATARISLAPGHEYQAVLLDIGLPDASGLQVLSHLRDRYDATPVLIVTARDQVSERIAGLDAGADDYVVKPFQLDELSARLRAVIRRSQQAVTPQLQIRDIVIEPARRQVYRAGRLVSLSEHEYRTLLALLESRGRTLAREHLEDAVYGNHGTIESNTVAVYIHQLRRKLGNDLIQTVHGSGYRIDVSGNGD